MFRHNITSYLNVHITTCFRTTRHLYINTLYKCHNLYIKSTIITDFKELHNVLDTLQPVQNYFNLKIICNYFYAHPVYSMGSQNV